MWHKLLPSAKDIDNNAEPKLLSALLLGLWGEPHVVHALSEGARV